MINYWVRTLNSFAWMLSNILVLYIAVMLVIFVIGYFILFDPTVTTAGKYIFRFFLSLFGLIALAFISVFVDPKLGQSWVDHSTDVLVWRPFLRLLAYGYVAYTVTSLAVLLIVRKWWPSRLRTSLDYELVKPRKPE